MTAERDVMLVKKVTYFGEFSYLNSSCLRKSIILMQVLSSSSNKFMLPIVALQKLSDRSFCWFPAVICWCPSGWAPAWPLHTNLSKFGWNISPHISVKKNCCDLNLGESLCIFAFFLFRGSGLIWLTPNWLTVFGTWTHGCFPISWN